MSGKLLIEWKRQIIKEIATKRYLSAQELLKYTHAEIATMFFSEFCQEENSESEDEPGFKYNYIKIFIGIFKIILAPLMSDIKETPFQSTLHSDVTYSSRHVEESWIHLLKAGDIIKLKTLTMCNYDFLLATVIKYELSVI